MNWDDVAPEVALLLSTSDVVAFSTPGSQPSEVRAGLVI